MLWSNLACRFLAFAKVVLNLLASASAVYYFLSNFLNTPSN
jgi:hypothetical protein